tara:strand:- start:9569 stop:10294 length:726 start_codon:yes stop_codon:yes gene_type:complete
MKIAIIGSSGFFGSELQKASLLFPQNQYFYINRTNFTNFVKDYGDNIDIVINSAMPSARFWAENNPEKDFIETVQKTRLIIDSFPNAKIVQISSISARTQLNRVYGRHKRAAEVLLRNNLDLTFRLGPLYGPNLEKGVIIDLINNRNVFVSEKSKYGFTSINWAAETIIGNLNLKGTIELGAEGFLTIKELKKTLNSFSECNGQIDDQVFDKIFENTPPASNVVSFAKEKKIELNNNEDQS